MKYSTYEENRFRSSVDKALQQVKSILDTTRRHARLANTAEVAHHSYDDKYLLAESVTNCTLASLLTSLEKLGLTAQHLQQAKAKEENITLRFEAQDGCYFLKEQEVDVITSPEIQTTTTTTTTDGQYDVPPGTPSPGHPMTSPSPGSVERTHSGSNKTTTTHSTARIVQKVKEYHWRVETSHKILLLLNHNTERIELQSRNASTIIVTTGNSGTSSARMTPRNASDSSLRSGAPIADKTMHSPIDVNITWLLSVLQDKEEEEEAPSTGPVESKEEEVEDAGPKEDDATSYSVCQFAIDRENEKTCKTPRRNAQIQQALESVQNLSSWMHRVQYFFLDRVEGQILGKHAPAARDVSSTAVLEIGTHCALDALLKEPRLNGKIVIVREQASNDRYRVEPANASDGLPPSLLVKRQNLKVEANQPASANRDGPSLSKIQSSDILVPVVPIFMQNDDADDETSTGVMLTLTDANTLLQNHTRTLNEVLGNLAQLYPPRQLTKLVSTAEASIVLLAKHVRALHEAHRESVNFIEGMLTQQLVSAIGKEINSRDFDHYMRFYLHKKLFHSAAYDGVRGNPQQQAPSYAPQPFTYSIRRPNHYPDGILSIEASRNAKEQAEPIDTMVRKVSASTAPSIFVPLNAATSVELAGDLYLHGWMQHVFQANSSSRNQHHLVARARQFSSFMILVGTMAGATQFEPKHAIILQNKDEILIPLLTQVLPTAREFKDSIASLSPEQRDFCRAFRTMQLESSVFGVVVVQIKPQLEKLLGLPTNALTKEIELTQDLMSLFCEYQIPSDLLSFDGPDDADMATKLSCVKGYVQSVMKVIEASKEKQLIEEERKADMRFERSAAAPEPILYGAAPEPIEPAWDWNRNRPIPGTDEPTPLEFAGAPETRRQRPMFTVKASAQVALPRPQASPTSSTQHRERRREHARAPHTRSSASPPTAANTAKLDHARQQTKSFEPDASTSASTSSNAGEDFTLIPKILDAKVEAMGDAVNNSLRSTIIKTGTTWTRLRQENLLTPIKSFGLATLAIENEKKKAFDLLDALSRSGTLPIECAELHVVVGMSHCFENDVMGTIIQDNINPIEKVERSALLLASAIHGIPPDQLVGDTQQLERLTSAFPQLFIEEGRKEEGES